MLNRLRNFKHAKLVMLALLACIMLTGAVVSFSTSQSYGETLEVDKTSKKTKLTTNTSGKNVTYTVKITSHKKKDGKWYKFTETYDNVVVNAGSTLSVKGWKVIVENPDSWDIDRSLITSYGVRAHYSAKKSGEDPMNPIYCCDPKRKAGTYRANDYKTYESDTDNLIARTISWGYYDEVPAEQFGLYTKQGLGAVKDGEQTNFDNKEVKYFIAATQIANWSRHNKFNWSTYKYYASYDPFTVNTKTWKIAQAILKNADSNRTPPGYNSTVDGTVKEKTQSYKIKTLNAAKEEVKTETSISYPKSIGSTYFTSTGWKFATFFWIESKDNTMLPAMRIERRADGSKEWKTWYELPAVFNEYADKTDVEKNFTGGVDIILNGEKKHYDKALKAYEDFVDAMTESEVETDDKMGGIKLRSALAKTNSSKSFSGGDRIRVKFEFDGMKLGLFALGVTNTTKSGGYYTSNLSAEEFSNTVNSATGNGYKNIFQKIKQVAIKGKMKNAVVSEQSAFYLKSSLGDLQRYYYYSQRYSDVRTNIALPLKTKSVTSSDLIYANSSDLVINKYPLSSLRDNVVDGSTNSSLQTYDFMMANSEGGTEDPNYKASHDYTGVSRGISELNSSDSTDSEGSTGVLNYINLNLKAGLMSTYDSNYLMSIGAYAKIQTVSCSANAAESYYYRAFQHEKYQFVPIGNKNGMKKYLDGLDDVDLTNEYLDAAGLTADTADPAKTKDFFTNTSTVGGKQYEADLTGDGPPKKVGDTTILSRLKNMGVSKTSAQKYCRYLAQVFGIAYSTSGVDVSYAYQTYEDDDGNDVEEDPAYDFGFVEFKNGDALGAAATPYRQLLQKILTNQNNYTIYANYRTWVASNEASKKRLLTLDQVINVADVQEYLNVYDRGDFTSLTTSYAQEYYENNLYQKALGLKDYTSHGDSDTLYSYTGLGKRYHGATASPDLSVFFDKKLWMFNSKETQLVYALVKNESVHSALDQVYAGLKITGISDSPKTGFLNSYLTIKKIGTQYKLYENNSVTSNLVQKYTEELYNSGTLAGVSDDSFVIDSLSKSKIKYCILAAVYCLNDSSISAEKITPCAQAIKSFVCQETTSVAISGTSNVNAVKVIDSLFHMYQIANGDAYNQREYDGLALTNGTFTKAQINETVGTRVPSSIMTFFKAKFASNGDYVEGSGKGHAPNLSFLSTNVNDLIANFGYNNMKSNYYDAPNMTGEGKSLCRWYAHFQFYSMIDELLKQADLPECTWGCYEKGGENALINGTEDYQKKDGYVGDAFNFDTLKSIYEAYVATKAGDTSEDNKTLIDSFLENCTSNIYYPVFKQALATYYSNNTVNATYRIYPINIKALQLVKSTNKHTDVNTQGVAAPYSGYWVNKEGEQCIGYITNTATNERTGLYTDDQSGHYVNTQKTPIGSNMDAESTIYDYRADIWVSQTEEWFLNAFKGSDSEDTQSAVNKLNLLEQQIKAAGYEYTSEKVDVVNDSSKLYKEGDYTEKGKYKFITGYADRDTDTFREKVTDGNFDDEDKVYFEVSTTNGSLDLNNIPAGDYYIVETSTDAGYTMTDSRAFLSNLTDGTAYTQAVNPSILTDDNTDLTLASSSELDDTGSTLQKYSYQAELTNLDVHNTSTGETLSDEYTRGFVYNAAATKGYYGEAEAPTYKAGYAADEDGTSVTTDADDLVTIGDAYSSYLRAGIIYWFNGYQTENKFNKFGIAYGGVTKEDVKANVAANASYFTTYEDDNDPTTLNKASEEAASKTDPETGKFYKTDPETGEKIEMTKGFRRTGTQILYDENATPNTTGENLVSDALAASYKLGDKEIQLEDANNQDDVENSALTGLHRNVEISNQSLSGINTKNLGMEANAIVKIFTTSEDAEFYCKSVALAKNLVKSEDDNSYIGAISDFTEINNLYPGSYTIMELQPGYSYINGVVVPDTGKDIVESTGNVTASDIDNFTGMTGEFMIKPYVNKLNGLFATAGQWWRNWSSISEGLLNQGYFSDVTTNTANIKQAIKSGVYTGTESLTFNDNNGASHTVSILDWGENIAATKYKGLSSVIGVVPTIVESSDTNMDVLVDTDEEAWSSSLALSKNARDALNGGTLDKENLTEVFSASNIRGYTSSPWVKIGTFEVGNYTQTKIGNSNLLNISNEILPCITLMKLDQNDYDVVNGTIADDGSTSDGLYSYNVRDIVNRAEPTAGYLNSAEDDANFDSNTGMKFAVDNWSKISSTPENTSAGDQQNTGFSHIYSYAISDTSGNQTESTWTPTNLYLTKFRLTSVSQAADGTWYADGVGTDSNGMEIWSNGAVGDTVYDTDKDGIVDKGVKLLDADGDGKIDSSDISGIIDDGFIRIEGVHPGYYTVEELECYNSDGQAVPVTDIKLTKYVGVRYTGYEKGYDDGSATKFSSDEKFDTENIFVVENATDETGEYKINKVDENGNPISGVTFSLSKRVDLKGTDSIPDKTEDGTNITYCTPNDFNTKDYSQYKALNRAYYNVQTTDESGVALFTGIPYDVEVDKFGNYSSNSVIDVHLEEIDHGTAGTIPYTKVTEGYRDSEGVYHSAGELIAWSATADGCQICNTRGEVEEVESPELYHKVTENATIGNTGEYSDESLLERFGYNDSITKITGSKGLAKFNTVVDTKKPNGKYFSVAKKVATGDGVLLETPTETDVTFYLDPYDAEEGALQVYLCTEDIPATADTIARCAGQYYLARPIADDPAVNEFTDDGRFELVENPVKINETVGKIDIFCTENWNGVDNIYVAEKDDSALQSVWSGDLVFKNGVKTSDSGTKLTAANKISPKKYPVKLITGGDPDLAEETTKTDNITFFNKGNVSITLHKYNDNSQNIAGATFYVIPSDVYNADTVDNKGALKVDAEANGIIVLNTNANGSATTGNVLQRDSSYVIVEGPAPDGYLRYDGVVATFNTLSDNCSLSDCSFDLSDECGKLDTEILDTNSISVIDKRPNVEFWKVNENGVGLNGAEFSLVCTSDKGIATKYATSVKKGSKDGYVLLENIPVADYELYEVNAPNGYIKIKGVAATITAEEMLEKLSSNTITSKTYKVDAVENTPIKGRIRVLKESTDESFLDEHTLEGATFRIVTKDDWKKYGRRASAAKDYDGKAVSNLVSNKEGVTDYCSYLAVGDYVVFETSAPKYMQLNEDWYYEFTIDSSWVDDDGNYIDAECSCENTPWGTRIKVYKYDNMTQNYAKPLNGAEFTLYSYEGDEGEDDYTLPADAEVVDVGVSGDDGYCIFSKKVYLDDKKYCIRETKAPAGYWLGTVVNSSNTVMSDKDESGITEYNKSQVYYLDEDYFKTDTALETSNGKVTVKYPPTVSVGDIAKLRLRINKHTDSGRLVANAGFTVYKAVSKDTEGAVTVEYKDGTKTEDGCYVTSGETKIGYGVPVSFEYTSDSTMPSTKTAQEFFTDDKGRIDFPGYLELGDYYVVETTTPIGYATADSVKLTIDGDTSYVLDSYGKHVVYDVTEIPVGFLKLYKKDDADTMLEGIEFTFTDSAGNSYKAVTDSKGECSLGYDDLDNDGRPDGVPLGDYTISETKIPDKYDGLLKMSDMSVTLTEDNATYDSPYIVNVTDIYNTSVKVYKLEEGTDKPLAGAEFTLFDGAGKAIATAITDETGVAVFSKLIKYNETYSISETKAPEGYVLNTSSQTVTYLKSELDDVTNQEDIEAKHTLYFYNTPIIPPTFKLLKEADDGTGNGVTSALPGAEVALYDADKNLVSTKTTDKEGYAVWENLLPNSVYYYKEVKAPEGYALDSTMYTFTTGDTSGDIIERILINQQIKHSIIIIKKDNDNNTVANAVINLYDADVTGMSEEDVKAHTVGSVTTGSDGLAAFNNLKDDVTYYYQEVQAPSGYVLDNTVYKFVSENETIINSSSNTDLETKAKELVEQGYEVSMLNNDIIKVLFTKLDTAGEVISKAGCVIAIYDSEGKEVAQGTTDATGKITFTGLNAGNYTYREVIAPEGYKLNENTFSFVIGENDREVLISMEDEALPYGDFEFTKVDMNNESVLIPDCEIVIRDSAGNEVVHGVTDANGKYSLKLPEGTYTYQEVKAPKGYKIDTNAYEFKVEGNKVTSCVMKDEIGTGSGKITKSDINTGEKIPNCGILIKDENGNEVVRDYTDENGDITFDKFPVGTYYYSEFDAPEGWLLNEKVYSFTIKEDGDIVKCKMKDVRKGSEQGIFDVLKIDSKDNSKVLPGATFVVLDKNKKKVATKVTDSDGVAEFALPLGTYYVKETKAPDGYVLDSSLHKFTISTEGEYVQYEKENTPQKREKVVTVRVPKTGTILKVGSIVLITLGVILGGAFLFSIGYFTIRKKRH